MTGPVLQLEQVTRCYGGLVAVNQLSIEVPPGARRAIIGPNGAGKTTLLHLIAGSQRPTAGRIRFDNRDITQLTPTARARLGIGRTWQHPAVFAHLSVADHLTLARRGGRRLRGSDGPQQRLVDQQLLEQIGLDRQLATPAGHLPYGQRRLLELVTAFAAGPRLLLLDEPSAGLDTTDQARIADLITGLPPDVTVIVVDHDLDLVWRLADSVTVLDHGRHLTTGTPAEIRADQRVQRTYLGATFGKPTETHPAPVSVPTSMAGPPLLQVRRLQAGYQGAPVLTGVDLDLSAGEVLAILGRQGAGKTTFFAAVAGLHTPDPPTSITLDGVRLPTGDPATAVRAGIALVPQTRRLFATLTVDEHIRVAQRHARRTGRHVPDAVPRWSRSQVLDLFPALASRLRHRANQLSGGEQQMLAVARALLTQPRVLLLDEPAEGLAPTIREQITATLRQLADDGLAIAITEPNLSLAAVLADQIIVVVAGAVALRRSASALVRSAQRLDLDRLLSVDATSS